MATEVVVAAGRTTPLDSKAFLVVAVGIVVLNPQFFLPESVPFGSFSYFLYLLLIGSLLLQVGISRQVAYPVLLSLITSAYVIALVLISGADDPFGVRTTTLLIAQIPAMLSLASMLFRIYERDALRVVFRWTFLITSIHTAIIIVSYFAPDITSPLGTVLRWKPREGSIRAPGLSHGAGDTLAMIHAAGIVFASGYLRFIKASRSRLGVSFVLLLGALSTLLAARIGVVLVVAGLVVYALLHRFGSGARSPRQKPISRIARVVLASCLLGLALFILPAFSASDVSDRFREFHGGSDNALSRALEPMREFEHSGRFTTRSGDALFGDHLITPEDPVHFLFGNGYFGRTAGNLVASDIGYVRLHFGMGLVGSLFYYALFLYIGLFAFRRQFHPPFDLLGSLLVVGALGHYKGPFFSNFVYVHLLFLLFFLGCIGNSTNTASHVRTANIGTSR